MTSTVAATKRDKRRVAMILSGGGARGAYEVGVLWYVFDELTRILGAPPKVDILCGTSVGAINASFLAAHLGDPVLGMRRLVELWSDRAHPDARFRAPPGGHSAASAPRRGRGTASSTCAPWRSSCSGRSAGARSRAVCGSGRLRALTVSCTEVSTGRTVVFMQTSPDLAYLRPRPPYPLPRRSDRPSSCARERRHSNAVSARARRRGALPRRRSAPEHAHRPGAASRRDAHIRHRSSREIKGRVMREAGHHGRERPGLRSCSARCSTHSCSITSTSTSSS